MQLRARPKFVWNECFFVLAQLAPNGPTTAPRGPVRMDGPTKSRPDVRRPLPRVFLLQNLLAGVGTQRSGDPGGRRRSSALARRVLTYSPPCASRPPIRLSMIAQQHSRRRQRATDPPPRRPPAPFGFSASASRRSPVLPQASTAMVVDSVDLMVVATSYLLGERGALSAPSCLAKLASSLFMNFVHGMLHKDLGPD